jgi:hypothetical protein
MWRHALGGEATRKKNDEKAGQSDQSQEGVNSVESEAKLVGCLRRCKRRGREGNRSSTSHWKSNT